MSYLSEYIKSIVVVIVVWSFVQIILPDADLKKYVRFTIGIIIIATLMTPILKFKDINFNSVLLDSQLNYSEYTSNNQINEVFIKKVEEHIKNKFNIDAKIYIDQNRNITKIEVNDKIKKEQIEKYLGLIP